MTLHTIIFDTIRCVTTDLGKPTQELHDELHLAASGLDSLGLAVVVARLEDKLGVDPFSSSVDSRFPVTLGDLVELYDSVMV
jgi:acyl carrier protein